MRLPLSPTPSSPTDAVLNAIAAPVAPRISNLVLFITLGACGNAEAGPPPTATTPSLTLSLSAPALTIRAGDEALLQVLLTRANLSQVVRLTVSDLPLGMVGTFTVPTLPAGTVASTLLLNASRATRAGTFTAIITASAAGVNAQTLPLTITITPAPAIALTAKPESLSIIAGGSGSLTLDIERTAYTGSVFFESEGAPPGVTTTFPDSPTTGSLATAMFTTSVDVLPGVYVFAINGFAAGLPAVNTFVQLAVLAPLITGFDVRVDPEVVTLRQGAPDSTTVTIVRRNYEGEVTLSAAGLPAGVGVTFNPTVTKGTTAIATFFAGPGVALGSYALTVNATGERAMTMSTSVDLLVVETPTLRLEAPPEVLTVTQGDSTYVTLTLVRTNLAGEVQLSATGLPPGVSLFFAGNPTTETSVPLRIVVGIAAAAGTYLLTIHGSATGIVPVPVTLTLKIVPPS